MSDTSPNRYHRHLHLRGYDDSQAGAYFITICTHRRACLFGAIEREAISLNDAGLAVQRVWASLPERFDHVETDALVVMPNHLHGIIVISGGANDTVPPSGIVGAFKSLSTRE